VEETGIEQARKGLGEIVDRARIAGEHTVITRAGKPAAVIVPVEWYEEVKTLIGKDEGGQS